MPKGYWIARVDVTNPDGYKTYVAANAEPFGKFGARFLVRSGTFTALEGSARQRNVVIAFADYDTALGCWHSPEYRRAKTFRDGHAVADIVAAEGVADIAAADSGADIAAAEGADGSLPAGRGGAPKGYWVGRIDVTDPEAYRAYVAADAAPLAQYGARFLVRGGRHTALEGEARSRNILFEFESYEKALACYRCDEYQRARRLREGHAHFDLIAIEGYGGPQL